MRGSGRFPIAVLLILLVSAFVFPLAEESNINSRRFSL
jgi:hypothetical protein